MGRKQKRIIEITKNETAKEYGTVQYTYHCKKCSSNYKYILKFEEWRDNDYSCPECQNKLKYLTSTDIREGDNINYISVEKGSEANKKRIGRDKYEEMCNADTVVKAKREGRELSKKCWWRKDGKPLDLSKINHPKRYIENGE